MIPFYVLSIPVAISLVLLFGDSLRRRGIFTTVFIFVIGFVFFSIKENFQHFHLLFNHSYESSRNAAIYIYKIPLGIVLGHLYTITVCWSLAEKIINRDAKIRGLTFQTLFFIMAITTSLAYTMEISGTLAGWWKWNEPTTSYSISVPFNPMYIGWPSFVFGFLYPFFLIGGFNLKRRYWLILAGHILFFVLIYREILLNYYIYGFILMFVLMAFSHNRSAFLMKNPDDRIWLRLPNPVGWMFDHALEFSILLNLAVVGYVHLTRAESPIILYSLISWTGFCAMAILPVSHKQVIVVLILLSGVSFADSSGRFTFSLIALYLGYLFLMAPNANRIWQAVFIFSFVGGSYLFLYLGIKGQTNIQIIPVAFDLLAVWYLMIDRRRNRRCSFAETGV